MSDTPQRPLSDAERTALEQRLAQLRAMSAASHNGVSSTGAAAPAPAPAAPAVAHTTAAPGGGAAYPPPRLGYGYADDDGSNRRGQSDDDDDGYDEGEEAFLNAVEAEMVASQAARQDAPPPSGAAARRADDERGTVESSRREVGDFELLRLAKMGDAESFFSFAAMTGTDITTFVDNDGRNALHYAADSGNLTFIRTLREKKVPYVISSEKHISPLAIALLSGQSADVCNELRDMATKDARLPSECVVNGENSTDPAVAAAARAEQLETLLRLHAPLPPRFVVSRPAPAPPLARRGGAACTSWGTGGASTVSVVQAAMAPQTEDGIVATVVPHSEEEGGGADGVRGLTPGSAQALVARLTAGDGDCGCSGWLEPLELCVANPTSVWPQTSVVVATDPAVTADANEPAGAVGAVVCLRVEGAVVATAAATTAAAVQVGNVCLAGCLSVAPAHRRRGVARALLRAVAATAVATSSAAVAFTTSSLLPSPPASVAVVKWFRRIIDPLTVLSQRHTALAAHILPEFEQYDEVLRADCVLKGAVPQRLREKHEAALTMWSSVDPSDDTQAELLLEFIKSALPGCADCYVVPDDVNQLRRCGMLSSATRTYVRTNADGSRVTDVVVFRLRSTNSSAADAAPVIVAEVVYAIFTTLKATEKAEHLLIIAKSLLNVQALVIPALFGFTESDLVKANLEELSAAREFAYLLYTRDGQSVESVPAVPPAKVFLPLFLL